ncbi:MAG: TonB-dependent receptor, partial [Bacteroidota bacterium]
MKPFFRLSTLPLILLLCCLTNIRLIGQNASIFGTISNEKELLPYASVFLKGQNRGTTSDETGAFRLDGLSAGTYTLTASYVGYANRAHEVTLAAGEQLRVDFVLPPAEELEAVVVTGTLKPTYVSDSPIKVDVITAKQLDTYIPAAASSVVEGIQLVNGVQEVVACGVCYTNNISINGLQGAYTAVLMDGTPMFGNLASVYGLNGIPNMIIDRFEVIKGPSSTLYGSEAVAGVINIITKDPAKQPLLSVDLMGTSRGEHFGNLAIAPKLGKTSGYIGLNYAYDNDF